MLGTLLLCFCIIYINEKYREKVLGIIITFILCLVSFVFDWGLFAPIFTVLFTWARNNRNRLKIAYAVAVLLYVGLEMWAYSSGGISTEIVFNILRKAFFMGMSGVCILFFYNGKRMERGRNFSKWFFYVFYPAHLIILCIIKICM